jgi:hypothetical protein
MNFWTLELICKMVHDAPQCWDFSSFGFEHHYISDFYGTLVARERRRGDRPPSMGMDIYLVNVGRQGILCLLAVKNGVGVAT